MSVYVDQHRARFGVEPICRTLDVSASAYYHRARGGRCDRAVEDERLLARIRQVHLANYEAYGHRRTWKALRRAGETAPRCQVQRLMRAHGIQGAKRRGKPWRTTKPDPLAHRRPDLVQRRFTAEQPVHRPLRREVDALVQQRRVHVRGGAVTEPLLVQSLQHRVALWLG